MKKKVIKLLIVDDHKMVRGGLRSMLESQDKRITFHVKEANNGEEGVAMARKNMYDIIIMDYQLPIISGVEATRIILNENPEAKIIALSNYDEYMYISNMINAGARGFVLKNIGPEEIVRAIETILNKGYYYSGDIFTKLISFDRSSIPAAKLLELKRAPADMLSKRELEILKLIALELTNDEIALTLFISKRTVETHRQNILKKLNVKNSVGLIKYAYSLKLFEQK